LASTDLDPARYDAHRQAESDATTAAEVELNTSAKRRKVSEAALSQTVKDLADTEQEIADTLESRP